MRAAALLLAIAASAALDLAAQGGAGVVPAALRPAESVSPCTDGPCLAWPARFGASADAPVGGPQEASDDVRSPTVAAILSLTLGSAGLQGMGSYYAGSPGHGTRHLLIGLAGVGLLVAGVDSCDGWLLRDCGGEADALIAAGVAVYAVNLGWSTVVAIRDVDDHNARRR